MQAAYSHFLELWKRASEEEREELLPLVIERVDVTTKQEAKMCLVLADPDFDLCLRGGVRDNATLREDDGT